jgi:hypothetical protein
MDWASSILCTKEGFTTILREQPLTGARPDVCKNTFEASTQLSFGHRSKRR